MKPREVKSLKEATRAVQETVQEPGIIGQQKALRNKEILEEAMAGAPGAKEQALEVVKETLDFLNIEVQGMSLQEAALEIYKYAWGLDVLEELYEDPTVNEIRVNRPDQVKVLRNIKNEPVPAHVRFRDDEHVKKIIIRMTMHDQGVGLNKSNPTIESMRKDGTRITATCSPVSEYCTLVLRKHTVGLLTPEDYIRSGVMSEAVWGLLEKLVRGRANILIAGGVGSGKTTLMRTLFAYSDPLARTVVIESDRELQLVRHFPDRDIIELEEHPEVGRPLKSLFRTVLRYSPNMILVGEFRGGGEASEAVRACLRGHDGSMATAHFPNPREAVEGTGRLLVEEGLNLSAELAAVLVASAYNVVVQMFGDSTRGVMLLESVTELVVRNNVVEYRPLVKWVPEGSDFLKGSWQFVGSPSERLIERLRRYGVVLEPEKPLLRWPQKLQDTRGDLAWSGW